MGRMEMDSRPAVVDYGRSAGQTPSSPRVSGLQLRGVQRNATAEAIVRVHGGSVVSRDDENGVVQMKIVVSKQQLRQMVLSMGGRARGGSSSGHPQTPPPTSSTQVLEQLLHVMRRRHMKKAESEAGKAGRSAWTPALQSIPEEM